MYTTSEDVQYKSGTSIFSIDKMCRISSLQMQLCPKGCNSVSKATTSLQPCVLNPRIYDVSLQDLLRPWVRSWYKWGCAVQTRDIIKFWESGALVKATVEWIIAFTNILLKDDRAFYYCASQNIPLYASPSDSRARFVFYFLFCLNMHCLKEHQNNC